MTPELAKWVGVKLVAVGSLKWTCNGVLVAFDEGDVFELDEDDLAVPGVDPAFWLKVGAAKRYVDPKPAKPEAKPETKAGPKAEPKGKTADG